MEGLLVLKEETVATSLGGLVYDPSQFIVEEYQVLNKTPVITHSPFCDPTCTRLLILRPLTLEYKSVTRRRWGSSENQMI